MLRVKGGPIDVGYRILLANKGACGKWKLAGLWEDTVYTVVGFNADSNTYRIQHSRSGIVNTVHLNLKIPVNFLRLPDEDLEGDTTENHMSVSDSIDYVVANVSENTSNYRTQECVSQLPSDGTNDAGMDDVEEATDVLETIQAFDTAQSSKLEHDVIDSSDTTQLRTEGYDDIEGMNRGVPESIAEQVKIYASVFLSAAIPNAAIPCRS